MENKRTITLSDEEYEVLLLQMGYAMGAARRDNNLPLAHDFLRNANAVCRDQPDWRPYEVPEKGSGGPTPTPMQ